jgi:hypothetical protein
MNEENNPPTGNDFWAPKKPNWDDWRTVKQARLWSVVALASDLDPSNFQTIGGPQLARWMKVLPQQVEDLLAMAKSSIGANGILKLVSKSAEGLEESEVTFSNFSTWLKSIKHQPPTEFHWQTEAITFRNLDWPWGRHETDLLRKLAEATHKFWGNYDPRDNSTAPTNQQVSDWLKSQGVADRTAEVIATIIRVEGLPTGPRK